MKKLVLCIFVVLFSLFASAGKIRMAFGYNCFYAQKSGNYVETYVKILSNSILYKKVEGVYQGEVELQIIFSKDDSIASFTKYRVKSLPVGDSIFEDFYSIKRFSLLPGKYLMEIYALDVNQPLDTIRYEKTIVVPPVKNDVQFSDIELLNFLQKSKTPTTFTKSGYDMVPRILNYYNDKTSKLIFYIELYNTHLLPDTLKYFVKYFIAKQGENKAVSNIIGSEIIQNRKVTPIVKVLDIAALPTGQYDLVLEFYTSEGIKLRTKKAYFDRFNVVTALANATQSTQKVVLNPYFRKDMHSDSLFYYLLSLTPMSSQAEQDKIFKIVKDKDTAYARKYFQAYWVKTSPENTAEAWLKYKRIIHTVESNYGSSIKPGFATDRGRIFIKYGVPNSIVSRPSSPNQYPYEIWQYYKISNRNNVLFVFYNPKVVGNDYQLLHSDLPGMRFNNNWKNLLYIQKGGVNSNGGHINDMNILNSRSR